MNRRPDRILTNPRKVVYMNRPSTRDSMAERIGPREKSPQGHGFRRAFIIGIGLLSIGMASLPLVQTVSESKQVQEKYMATKQLEEEAMLENAKTQEEYQHMQDPDYLADVARRDYLYSKPGEIVFDIKE